MSEKKKVIFLSLGDYSSDSRIYKQAHSLEEAGYNVIILAVWRKGLEKNEKDGSLSIERFYFPLLKKIRFPFNKRKLLLPFFTLKALSRIVACKADAVQCERAYTIHIGLLAKWFLGVKFTYDSEELAAHWPPMIKANSLTRKLLIAYERFVSKRAEFVIQTTESRAEQFYKQTKLNAVIIMNKPIPPQNGESVTAIVNTYHNNNLKVVCYVGAVMPGRGIEHVAEAVSDLDGVKFVLLGPLNRAGEFILERYSERIDWIQPVHPTLITSVLRGVDVGISFMQNTCLSYYYSCPTKVWELLVAGVPQLGSDFPEYRRIIRENSVGPVGRVCDPDNPEKIKKELHQMLKNSDELEQYHRNAMNLREQCVWETEAKKLILHYNNIV